MRLAKFVASLLIFFTLSIWSLIANAQTFNTFVRAEEGIKMAYPTDWHIKEYNKPDIYQLFISREPISKPKGQYHTGLSLLIFRHASRQFPLVSDDSQEVTAQLLNSYERELIEQGSHERLWEERNAPFLIGDLVASRSQVRVKFRNMGPLGVILISIYLPDDLYMFHFEAPLAEFEKAKALFEEMIRSIEILNKDLLPDDGLGFKRPDEGREFEMKYAKDIASQERSDKDKVK